MGNEGNPARLCVVHVVQEKASLVRGFFVSGHESEQVAATPVPCSRLFAQSPNVSNDALPPAAVVLMVIVFSVVKRGR